MRSIKIDDKTYDELLQLKRGNDTFDSVIRRAVAAYQTKLAHGATPAGPPQAAGAGQGA